MPADLESADTAHFAVEASELHESGAFTPERARVLTFCYYFRRRRFVLTYFGSRNCWGTEHQCKWNLLLPACWISRISRRMMQLGKKWLRVIYLLQFHRYCHLFIWDFEAYLDSINIHYCVFYLFIFFLWQLFSLEKLSNRWPFFSLNSWQQPAWFTYKTLRKPAQHCKWQWSHCDLRRHSTCLTGSCQKYLSFCQLHSLATTTDSMFFTQHFGLHSCTAARGDEDTVLNR